MNRLKLWYYKNKFKRTYMAWRRISDGYNCGAALMDYINPDLLRLREECQKLYDKCQALEKLL